MSKTQLFEADCVPWPFWSRSTHIFSYIFKGIIVHSRLWLHLSTLVNPIVDYFWRAWSLLSPKVLGTIYLPLRLLIPLDCIPKNTHKHRNPFQRKLQTMAANGHFQNDAEEYEFVLNNYLLFNAVFDAFGDEPIAEYGSYRQVNTWMRTKILNWVRTKDFY